MSTNWSWFFICSAETAAIHTKISSCVANRTKHLTMLLYLMLCRWWSIFGEINGRGCCWMNRLRINSLTRVVFLWRNLSVISTKVKCAEIACEFACNSKIVKRKKQEITYIWHYNYFFTCILACSSDLCFYLLTSFTVSVVNSPF